MGETYAISQPIPLVLLHAIKKHLDDRILRESIKTIYIDKVPGDHTPIVQYILNEYLIDLEAPIRVAHVQSRPTQGRTQVSLRLADLRDLIDRPQKGKDQPRVEYYPQSMALFLKLYPHIPYDRLPVDGCTITGNTLRTRRVVQQNPMVLEIYEYELTARLKPDTR